MVVEVTGLLVEVPGEVDQGEEEEAGQRILTAGQGERDGRPRSSSRVTFMELDRGITKDEGAGGCGEGEEGEGEEEKGGGGRDNIIIWIMSLFSRVLHYAIFL
uniref:Uncharacterized protein n=1 Tax=Amphimedon queenslandica TaxID=400682 RepID=A0A1X7UKG3_AMPQE